MKEGFRQSMAWLHTWSGLLVGWLLFLVFAAGTAAYFRDEITLWMKPELHAAAHPSVPQTVALGHAQTLLEGRAANASRWFITMPSEREPAVRASWMPARKKDAGEAKPRGRRRFESAELDPVTGTELSAPRATRGGDFFYRLHFDLHYMSPLWARWMVGVAAMFMLVAILSGIVTHKRIFKDFFTFRPAKGQRSWLDAHNVTAVLALPYHLMITFTGIVTLMFMYMPWGVQALYPSQDQFFTDLNNALPADAKPAKQPAPLAPLAPMLAQASAAWDGAPVGRVTVNFPGDANATVLISRQSGRAIGYDQPTMLFNGVSGRLLSSSTPPGTATETRSVLYGLHIARFSNPLLRGLFFLSGLAGCAMVATGLLLWAVKERQKHARALARGEGHFGLRLVDGLNIGAIAGVPLAMAAFFWANRLLPVAMPERPDAEIRWFFIAWGVSALVALARPSRRMWQLLLALGGVLFALLPLLNAMTGGAHLGTAIAAGLWPVAGFDIVTLALGIALLFAARRLGRPVAIKKAPVARVTAEAA